jgi:hypothetical protein
MQLTFIETPITGFNTTLGVITLSEDGELVADPAVVWALETPVGFPDTIDPKEDPEAWLTAAQIQYSGSAMRAVLEEETT